MRGSRFDQEKRLRPIAAEFDWHIERRSWSQAVVLEDPRGLGNKNTWHHSGDQLKSKTFEAKEL